MRWLRAADRPVGGALEATDAPTPVGAICLSKGHPETASWPRPPRHASTGTGFTPPAYAREVAAKLPQSHLVEVVRGDHDGWRALEARAFGRERTIDFLAGEIDVHAFPERIVRAELDIELVPSAWIIGGSVVAVAGLMTILLYRRQKRSGRS